MTSSSGDKNNEELAFGALILAAAFLVLSPVFYAVAATATLVGSGSLPPYWEAAVGTVQIPWHLSIRPRRTGRSWRPACLQVAAGGCRSALSTERFSWESASAC